MVSINHKKLIDFFAGSICAKKNEQIFIIEF